jgi:hypothetical protein
LSSIIHTLAFQSPCSEPVWIVLEGFEPLSSSDDLG